MKRCGILLGAVLLSATSDAAAPAKKAPARAAPASGGWTVAETKSAIDDSKTVVLALRANNNIAAWPRQVSRPMLFARCKEGKVDLFINVGVRAANEYGSVDTAAVRVRVDSRPAEAISMNESTDGQALFFPDPRATIKAILDSRRLLFEFTPFNSQPAQTTFTLTGLTTVLPKLMKACDWDPRAEMEAQASNEREEELALQREADAFQAKRAEEKASEIKLALDRLRAPDPDIRRAGIEGLAISGAVETLKKLEVVAAFDADPSVRSAATKAIARIKAVATPAPASTP
jgi:hypothetical protein